MFLEMFSEGEDTVGRKAALVAVELSWRLEGRMVRFEVSRDLSLVYEASVADRTEMSDLRDLRDVQNVRNVRDGRTNVLVRAQERIRDEVLSASLKLIETLIGINWNINNLIVKNHLYSRIKVTFSGKQMTATSFCFFHNIITHLIFYTDTIVHHKLLKHKISLLTKI